MVEISIKELMDLSCNKECPKNSFYEVGKNYFVRTVTMHHLGKLKFITDNELVFEQVSWVADDGRFHQFLKDGVLDEIEPFVDDVCVNRRAIIDITPWRHALPRDQK